MSVFNSTIIYGSDRWRSFIWWSADDRYFIRNRNLTRSGFDWSYIILYILVSHSLLSSLKCNATIIIIKTKLSYFLVLCRCVWWHLLCILYLPEGYHYIYKEIMLCKPFLKVWDRLFFLSIFRLSWAANITRLCRWAGCHWVRSSVLEYNWLNQLNQSMNRNECSSTE